MASSSLFSITRVTVIELHDGKLFRKPLYLMVKTMVSGQDFPVKTNPLTEGNHWETTDANPMPVNSSIRPWDERGIARDG